MKQQKVIFLLLVVTCILLILFSTGVGYAAVSNNSLNITEDALQASKHQDFRVGFTGKTSYVGNGGKAVLSTTGPRTGIMQVTGLKSVGDYVTGIFIIKNTSHDLTAVLSKTFTNSNPEYFKVKVDLTKTKLIPRNGQAELRITVEVIKVPTEKVETANISVKVHAEAEGYKY